MLKRLASFFYVSVVGFINSCKTLAPLCEQIIFSSSGRKYSKDQNSEYRFSGIQLFQVMCGETIFAFSHEFLLDCKFSGTQRSNVSHCGSHGRVPQKIFSMLWKPVWLIRSCPKKAIYLFRCLRASLVVSKRFQGTFSSHPELLANLNGSG